MKKLNAIFLFSAAFLLFSSGAVFAKTDVSISDNDLTFSKDTPFDGELIKIYARVFNYGDNDVSGYVEFSLNGEKISAAQPISIKPNTYDDVFVDWKAKTGTYGIQAKIIGLNLPDDDIKNNETAKRNFYVDKDTDSDGLGDSKDDDIDNDGLTNEEEKTKGTDPLKSDTDVDGINDKIDAFPKDKTESRDTDSDGIGDNKDTDTDGDTLTNEQEIHQYGTNPLNSDSDGDGFGDKKETEIKTDPNKTDTDGDGIIDSKDKFPLDMSKASASLMDSIYSFIKSKNSFYFIIGAPIVLLVLFLLFRRKRRRR